MPAASIAHPSLSRNNDCVPVVSVLIFSSALPESDKIRKGSLLQPSLLLLYEFANSDANSSVDKSGSGRCLPTVPFRTVSSLR